MAARNLVGRRWHAGILPVAALAVAAIGGQLRIVAPAMGQPARIRFDIPAQPLEAALRAYSLRTRVELLYSAQLVVGKRSHPVSGDFSPAEALDLLLSGTGLRARYAGDQAITLMPVQAPGPAAALPIATIHVAAPPVDTRPFVRYADALLADILAAIRRDPVAGRGDYEVTVRIWLDDTGAIVRTRLQADVPNTPRVDAIGRLLAEMGQTRPPPPGMPQPVGYRLRVRSAN